MLWTHKVDGLTENDFIFAAKVDNKLPAQTQGPTAPGAPG
jgi:pterin-4a-carbinolamine dehydratase